MKRKYVEMKPQDDPMGVTMPKMASYRAIAQLLPFLCLWPHCIKGEVVTPQPPSYCRYRHLQLRPVLPVNFNSLQNSGCERLGTSTYPNQQLRMSAKIPNLRLSRLSDISTWRDFFIHSPLYLRLLMSFHPIPPLHRLDLLLCPLRIDPEVHQGDKIWPVFSIEGLFPARQCCGGRSAGLPIHRDEVTSSFQSFAILFIHQVHGTHYGLSVSPKWGLVQCLGP